MEHNDILKNIGNQTFLFTFDFCQECVKISSKKLENHSKSLKMILSTICHHLLAFFIYLFIWFLHQDLKQNIILYSTEQHQGE